MAKQQREGKVHFGHKGRIFWLDSFPLPDDQSKLVVATACEDGKVGIWDEGCDKHWEFPAHKEEALRVSFSPCGELLYSGGSDGTLRAWRISSGSADLAHESKCPGAADEGQIYSILHLNTLGIGVAHDNCISVFDKSTLHNMLTWRFHSIGTTSFGGPRNPENKSFVFDSCAHQHTVFAALSDGSIRLRDVRSPYKDTGCMVGSDAFATCCTVDESGTEVAAGFGDGSGCVWDVRNSASTVRRYEQDQEGGPLFGVSFWPNGQGLLLAWSASGQMVAMHGEKQAVIEVDIRRRKHGTGYPIYCAKIESALNRVLVCGGQTPEETNRSGLRPTPSLAAGCIRVNQKPEEKLNPWMSVSLSLEDVSSALLS